MKTSWREHRLHNEMVRRIEELALTAPLTFEPDTQALRRLGVCSQVRVLLGRECRAVRRNKGILGARFGMAVFLAVLYSWLFAGSAKSGDDVDGQGECVTAFYDTSGCASAFQ